jgi:hypothetical protein
MTHTCHAIGCKANCHPEKLMCKKHWDMVPEHKQQRVYDEYRPGQCKLDPMPSPQWHDAADVAIYYVHIQELRSRLKSMA